MISVYAKGTSDFAGNGIMALDKVVRSCLITEELNGIYEAELECAFDSRLNQVSNDMVLRLPSPTRETPLIRISQSSEAVPQHIIWKVRITTAHANGYSRIYAQPTTTSKVLEYLREGTEYEYLGAHNSQWHNATSAKGTRGYMFTGNSQYVRTEMAEPAQQSYSTVVQPRLTRDQLFRIYSVESGLQGVTIKARHISYDLMHNYIKTIELPDTMGRTAMDYVLASTSFPVEFNGYSDMENKADFKASRTDPLAAIMDEAGLIGVYGGELLRDNYDLFWVNAIGYDRGVTIAYRKNMTTMEVVVEDEDVVTRIIPVGYDPDGNPIYLNELYVDSPHIADYQQPRVMELDCRDVKVRRKATDEGYADENAVREELRRRALAQFDEGIDLPKVQATVDWVDKQHALPKTAVTALNTIYLGDTVRVRHENYGFDLPVQVVAYVWDCLRGMFLSIELGSKKMSLSSLRINPELIPDGGVAGRKLTTGSVDEQLLQAEAVSETKIADGAVTSLKLGLLSVDEAHIKDASIDTAKIKDGAIDTAKIKDAAIDEAKIKDLSVTGAKIQDGEIGTAKIALLAVDTGQIQDLAVVTAKIAQLAVTTGKIDDAAITSAKIAAAQILSAHIVQAAIQTAHIEDAAVTAAKIREASINAAHIIDGVIDRAKIAIGAIGTAQIEDASIETAKIALGAITTALIEAGAVGTAQIADGSITNAKIVELNANKINAGTISVERLIIVGSEESIVFAINEANGTAQLSQTTIDGGSLTRRSITADTIVAGAITGNEIKAATILANNIAAGTITGANIAAETIEGSNISAGTLTTNLVAPDFGDTLVLSNNQDILNMQASISINGQGIVQAVNKITQLETAMEGVATEEEIQTLYTELQQTAQDFSFRVGRTEERLDAKEAEDADTADFKDRYEKRVNITEDGIIISSSDTSELSLRLDNARFAFLDANGNEIMWNSGQKQYINQLQVVQELQVGGFVWVNDAITGRMSILWRGV